jgi:hypothetical protein
MKKTAGIHFNPAHNGVYAAPSAPGPLRQAAVDCSLAWCELDLRGVHDKPAFLARCAAALHFPQGFGLNWDALADCMEDLAWQPPQGLVLHWHGGGGFARSAPADLMTALEIFGAAAAYWSTRKRCMVLLLDDKSSAGRVLPAFPQ